MVILGIDTSSDAAAIGLMADGVLLSEYTINNGKNHSVKFLPMIETMLQETGISFPEIDAYACGVGPGSFTGVRIGVATAKGFAQSWNKPVVPMSSLQLLAENICDFEGLRVSAIYARADELFCAAYDCQGQEVLAPQVMTYEELLAFLNDKTCRLVGDGAQKYREQIIEKLGDRVSFALGRRSVISGGAAAELGYRLACAGEMLPCEKMEPVYLRVSQAEREYAEKNKNVEIK